MSRAVVFPTRGDPRMVDVPEGAGWEWMRDQIGCEWIEIVCPQGLEKGFVMIIDEEGRLRPNRLNRVGTYLYGDPIVGDVLIMREIVTEEGGVCVGMTEEEAEDLIAGSAEFK